MRIGLYFDLRNPPPWRRPWADHYRRFLDLVETGERLGCDSIWLSEHHFFEDGYLPQPLTLAAAVAARTSRVRIGSAVLIAPLRRAVQIAEEAAAVDLVSDGRFDLGLGAGYRIPEFDAFGADRRNRFSTTEERATEVRRLLDEEVVTPPPLQRPFPVWLGYNTPAGAERAGKLGMGLLSLHRNLVEPYLAGFRSSGRDPATARMAGLVNLIVADDPNDAWQRIVPHYAYQLDTYRRYLVEGTGRPVPPPVDPSRLHGYGGGVHPPLNVLTPSQAVDFLTEVGRDVPGAEALIWASVAGMPDDLVDRHVTLLLEAVRPAVVASC